jgi:hypothetical protein
VHVEPRELAVLPVAGAEQDAEHVLGAHLERAQELDVEEALRGEEVGGQEEQDDVGLPRPPVDLGAAVGAEGDLPAAPAGDVALARKRREVTLERGLELFVLRGVAEEDVEGLRGHGWAASRLPPSVRAPGRARCPARGPLGEKSASSGP